MKKNILITSLILSVVLMCIGCGNGRKNTVTSNSDLTTETKKETETEFIVESVVETASETVMESVAETIVESVEEVSNADFDPVTEITDTMWVAYGYDYNNGYPMYVINFRSDGTMEYMAGWVQSEIAFAGEGTWTSSGDQITYNVTGDGYTFAGTLEFVLVAGDNLVISHVSGDALNYLLEEGPMEFVVQGSSMDNPPI